MRYEFLSVALIAWAPFALILAGAVLLALQPQGRPRGGRRSPWAVALKTLGWLLLLVGLFAGVALLANVLFVIAWIVTAVVLLFIRGQYRNMERRSLLWVLMAAAERGIPLETAAREFAQERYDWISARALELAEYLEAGLPLALAFERSRLGLPTAFVLAADMGQQTGRLGPALRQALSQDDGAEAVLRSAAEKLFYVILLAGFGLAMWTFLMIKVMPAYQKILDDFGMDLPAVTQGMFEATLFLGRYWLLAAPVVALVLFLAANALAYYTGLTYRALPGLGCFGGSAAGALVMRWLAAAVRQHRPIAEMIRLLAGYIPAHGARRKLQWAAKRIDQGAHWAETLRQAGLIRRAEGAVFKAAERTGNLAWALEEMADSSLRRRAYRLQAVFNVVFPSLVLLLGAGVLLIALASLAPLFALIQGVL